MPITEITSITELTILSSNNPLPTPVNIGKSYNNVPSLVIDNGNINDFNQYAYAIDYWENYESMLVRIDLPKVIGQLKGFGNFAVVLDMDNPNRITTTYGGVILEQNGNADIIQIANNLMPSNPIFYSVYPGDSISYITGVVSYKFGYYYILPRNISDIGIVQQGQVSIDLSLSTSTTPPTYVNQQKLTATYAKLINHKEFLNKDKINKNNNNYKYYKNMKNFKQFYAESIFKNNMATRFAGKALKTAGKTIGTVLTSPWIISNKLKQAGEAMSRFAHDPSSFFKSPKYKSLIQKYGIKQNKFKFKNNLYYIKDFYEKSPKSGIIVLGNLVKTNSPNRYFNYKIKINY